MAALLTTACAHNLRTVGAPDAARQGTDATTITWIEDKPGPTLQQHNVFPDVPDTLWDALGLQDGVPSSISCLLLRAEGKTILIDAGLGAPGSQLMPTLEREGVEPEALELIYITHMHPDHIGGMLKDGERAFPNAQVWVNSVEAAAWEAMDGERAALPHAVMAAYREQLHLFQPGDTLAGGVATIAAYGHTPGHTVFQKDSLLVIGDLLHGAALQMEHPEYCPFFDMDPEAATASRRRILDYARQHHLTMYGMHLPAPGYLPAAK